MSKILARARRSMRTGGPQIDEDDTTIPSPTSSSSLEEGSASRVEHDDNNDQLEKKDSKRIDSKDEKMDKSAKVEVVIAQQTEGEIKYRTMSWQKCAAILFGEYVCLAILSFPWAFKTLGELVRSIEMYL